MPQELKSKEDLEKLLETASEVRVSRSGDSAKVKLRTKAGLYTLKTTSEEADAIVKQVKIPVVEY